MPPQLHFKTLLFCFFVSFGTCTTTQPFSKTWMQTGVYHDQKWCPWGLGHDIKKHDQRNNSWHLWRIWYTFIVYFYVYWLFISLLYILFHVFNFNIYLLFDLLQIKRSWAEWYTSIQSSCRSMHYSHSSVMISCVCGRRIAWTSCWTMSR
jgi:hypothetical protein